jgi:glycosyltransferase involved in cell wall biosynthesis
MIKVLAYPYDKNPYQELLYSPMRRSRQENITIAYANCYPFIGALFLPVVVLFRRVQGYKLIHVHWPAFRIELPFIPLQKEFSYIFFKFCVIWLKILGYKIIWTVHNLVPHEPQTSNDLKSMQYFSGAVDAKIVHSRYAIDQMRKANLDIRNCSVIPIGSYSGIYPENINATDARKKLNISAEDLVILFFGLIRPYKGVEDLLKVFTGTETPHIRLVIAGKCLDEGVKKKIISAQKKHAIDFYNKFIPDEDVSMYFQASDAVCLPFKQVMSSSSALLAMGYGKPIIAPRLGVLRDLPEGAGFLYSPATAATLEESLHKLVAEDRQKLRNMGKVGKKYTQTLSWDYIAKQTYQLYGDVLNRPANENS